LAWNDGEAVQIQNTRSQARTATAVDRVARNARVHVDNRITCLSCARRTTTRLSARSMRARTELFQEASQLPATLCSARPNRDREFELRTPTPWDQVPPLS